MKKTNSLLEKSTAILIMCFMLFTAFSARADQTEATNTEVATKYFEAFAAHDAVKMGLLYADSTPDIFQDPVFTPSLNTEETRAMWELLLLKPIDYSVDFKIEKVIGSMAYVNWTARYIYSATGRNVENHGTTILTIENAKIVKQFDSFDLKKWLEMAFPTEQANLFSTKPDLFRGAIRKKLLEFMELKEQKAQEK